MRWIKSWFWSSVRESENWAQTIIRVLGNLLRIAFTAVLLLIAVGLVGYYWSERRPFDARHKVTASVEHRDHSSVRNSDGDKYCTEGYPLITIIRNESERTVASLTINLSGRERASVENKLSWRESRIDWTYVIPPGHIYTTCYRTGAEPREDDLIYSGEMRLTSVKFIDPEPWMFEESRAVEIREA